MSTNQWIWVPWMFGIALVGRIVPYWQAAKLKQLAKTEGVLVQLYWQSPLASVQANRWLYALTAIPMLMMLALSCLGLFTTDWSKFVFVVLTWASYLCVCDHIRGPAYFYISSRGIYWSQLVLTPHMVAATLYPWDRILGYRWKKNAEGDFFCFTPERDDKQFKTETQVGPFTADQRASIDAVLEAHAAELLPADKHATQSRSG